MTTENDNRTGIALLLPICLAIAGIAIGVTAAFSLVTAGWSDPRDILAAFARDVVAVWLVMLILAIAAVFAVFMLLSHFGVI